MRALLVQRALLLWAVPAGLPGRTWLLRLLLCWRKAGWLTDAGGRLAGF